jgi:hypothetical protein
MRRLAALCTLGVLLAFIVGLSPHLVHHLFEPGHRTVADECPFATAADREPGAAEGIVAPAAPAPPATWLVPTAPAAPPRFAVAPAGARAPPLPA